MFARYLRSSRDLALALGALLTPAALMAYVLGFWRLAADIGVAGQFGISGFFSHWQIWMLSGVALQFAGYALTRFGRDGALPQVKPFLFFMLPESARKRHSAPVSQAETSSR